MPINNTPAAQLQGFSVYQPNLGAELLFFPALGSKELDQLIDAYVPGPASAKQKRATISMDFFEHAHLTGDAFKFYTVDSAVVSASTDSPVSTSSGTWDSACGSGFDLSPALTDVTSWSFASLPQLSGQQTPVLSGGARQRTQKSCPAKKAASHPSTDFTSLPGMKILTKDGQDVTNSASRGCKTKEQRDHAHLMRVIKACDSCRRKKIRCDPSHKKRAATSQVVAEAKPAKKVKKAVAETPILSQEPAVDPSSLHFNFDPTLTHQLPPGAAPAAPLDNSWEEFVQLGQDFSLPPADLDLFLDSTEYFSPVDFGSSGPSSSSSPSTPFTPSNLGTSPANIIAFDTLSQLQPQQQPAALPYLDAFQAGTNYVDFNLYSPPSNFLDEEPISLNSAQVSPASHGNPTGQLPWDSMADAQTAPQLDMQPEALLDLSRYDRETLENIDSTKGSTTISELPLTTQPSPALPTLLVHPLATPPTSSTSSPGVIEDGACIDGVALLDVYSTSGLHPTCQQVADPERILQGPGCSTSLATDEMASENAPHVSPALPQIEVAATNIASGISSTSSAISETFVRSPSTLPVIGAAYDSRSMLAESRTRLESPAVFVSPSAAIASGEDEFRIDNVRYATQLDFVESGVETGRGSLGPDYTLASGTAVNVPVTLRFTSVYGVSAVGSRLVSSYTERRALNGGVSVLSLLAHGFLALAVATLVLVLNGVLLTPQAGSAKMPVGLFGLVYGGVVALAQALWPHTPPRSSRPTPEDYSSSILDRGVAVVDGGWSNGKMRGEWKSFQSSVGEKIRRLSKSKVSSSWRV
ncbi:hypothetical protein MKZ38_004308 [Zalerion maritima]|uniref:Uncharacterized protein n=1 Tax=Zalerion maritima TaxID=339359 RepID=A0AAD5WPL8_9PEZI|nr:hypothetical protein MKZ38_004308 [Zalerion maritima]